MRRWVGGLSASLAGEVCEGPCGSVDQWRKEEWWLRCSRERAKGGGRNWYTATHEPPNCSLQRA